MSAISPGAFVWTSFGTRRIVRTVAAQRSVRPVPTFFGPVVGCYTAGRARHGDRGNRIGEHGAVHVCRLPWPTGGPITMTIRSTVRPTSPTIGLDRNHRWWSPNDLFQDRWEAADFYMPPYHAGPHRMDGGRRLWPPAHFEGWRVGQFSAGWANKVDLPEAMVRTTIARTSGAAIRRRSLSRRSRRLLWVPASVHDCR